MADAVRRRGACRFREGRSGRRRARRSLRLRNLARAGHHLRVRRRPGRSARQAGADAHQRRDVVPAPRRRHSDAAGTRSAAGRARVMAARRAAPVRGHSVPDRVRRDASLAVSCSVERGAPGGRRPAVDRAHAVLARACADGPVTRPDTLDLALKVDAIAATIDRPEWPDAVEAVASELRAARTLGDALAPGSTDDPLLLEIGPWAHAARTEAEAGLAALRLLQQVRPVATFGDAGEAAGRAAAPDPEAAMQHAFVVLFLWAAARADEKVVYGPRFVVSGRKRKRSNSSHANTS